MLIITELVTTVTLCYLRTMGYKGIIFQAIAHVFVGIMLGMAFCRWRSTSMYTVFAASLITIEIANFVFDRLN